MRPIDSSVIYTIFRRAFILVTCLAAILGATVTVGASFGFAVAKNKTASMPIGNYIYRATSTVHRGDFVMGCLAPKELRIVRERHYFEPGECDGFELVLKIVAGVPGDKVYADPNRVCVNGRELDASGRVTRDRQGRSLSAIATGSRRLGSDEYWLETPFKGSWDSRYFGAVRRSQIRYRAWFIGLSDWSLDKTTPCIVTG